MTEAKGKPVDVKAAKGRPMLTWVGKQPLRRVTAFPAQHVETFDPGGSLTRKPEDPDLWKEWPKGYPKGGLLFHGDNKEVLAHLLANGFRGKVNLVYIDPPFDSGADYVRKVSLRGPKGTAKLDGETYTLGEQLQYTDIWANDNYLQFMYERLLLLSQLLSEDGSIVVHLDSRKCHHIRLLLEEIFGADCLTNQISWRRTSAHSGTKGFGPVTDTLLFVQKNPALAVWNPVYQEMSDIHLERHYRLEDEKGRYALGELTAPGLRKGPSGLPWRGFDVRTLGRHWAAVPEQLDRLDSEGLIYWPKKEGGWPRLKRYLSDVSGRACTDFWDDIDPINMVGRERVDYPTQKPEALLKRIIEATTQPAGLVLDCFVGSGTTSTVSQRLGRRWIGCDINKGAIQTSAKRLMRVIEEQREEEARRGEAERQQRIEGTGEDEAAPRPAQWGFTSWRVNDYDLAIRTTEAVGLACEHLGVSRTRTDRFFDGTLGKRLVKIVPFDHPLTPLDLEELRKELDARPEEDRDVVVAALGCEIAAQAWVDDWNRLRKGKGAANRIEILELRSDPRVGGFFTHQPATADVKIERQKDQVVVEILDFVSPSILQRLKEQGSIVKPRIDDFRAQIDWIEIDADYDGEVFDVALVDLPEKKQDLVAARYELPAPRKGATVAVKIVDMLGEEVLETRKV